MKFNIKKTIVWSMYARCNVPNRDEIVDDRDVGCLCLNPQKGFDYLLKEILKNIASFSIDRWGAKSIDVMRYYSIHVLPGSLVAFSPIENIDPEWIETIAKKGISKGTWFDIYR